MKSPTLPEELVVPESDTNFSEERRGAIEVREQRKLKRYNLHLPMVIRGLSDPSWCYVAQTVNISSGGILFVVDSQRRPNFEVGDPCQVEVQLMEADPSGHRVLLRAGGPIVRMVLRTGVQPRVQAVVKLVSSRVIRDIENTPSYTANRSVG